MTDDPRARFVIAQHFIEQGRYEEARLLLRSLDIPEAHAWADLIERGEPVDTKSLRWEPEMVRPMPPPKPPRQWQIKPVRILVSLMLAFSLMLPFLQLVVPDRPRSETNIENIQLRSEARRRVQWVCYDLTDAAIEQGRLNRSVGSCMEWSFKLTDRTMKQVVDCHERAGENERLFRACVIEHELLPDELNL